MLRPHLTPSPRFIFVCSLVLVAVVLAAVVLLVPGIALAADDLTTAADSMPIVGGAAIGSSAIASLYTWVSARERVLKQDHEQAITRLENAFNRSLLDLSRGIADTGKRVARNRGDIEGRVQEAEDRLARLEESAKHAPTAAQLTELLRLIGDLRADVKAQSVEMSGLTMRVSAELGALSKRFDNYELHMLEAKRMIPMFEVLAETRRGIILRIILDQGDFGVDEQSVMYGLEHKDIRPLVGPDIGRDVVRGDFAWLARVGLIHTATNGSGWSATITPRGQDVAYGRERMPGLKRWVG